MSNLTNAEDYFPGLHIHFLREQAEGWLEKYSEEPIGRILLYKFSSPYGGAIADNAGEKFRAFPYVYAIVFEVDAVNKLLEMSPSDLMAYDRQVMEAQHPMTFDRGKKDRKRIKEIMSKSGDTKKIEQRVMMNAKEMVLISTPYPDCYSHLLANTEPNSRKPYEQRYQHFIDENFREVYRQPVTDMDFHRKDWVFRVKFKNTDLNVNIRTDKPFVILASEWKEGEKRADERSSVEECQSPQSSEITEQDQSSLCETFVRSLRVYYENRSAIKIQEPKKKVKTFNHESLGFDREDTDEWTKFRKTIEGPDHFYKVGTTKDRKEYYRKYDCLRRINEKLVTHLLKKKYRLQVPENFRIYERALDEGSGVYIFKFLVGDDAKKSKYDNYSKEKWLTEFDALKKDYKEALEKNDENREKSLMSKIKSITADALTAGLITKQEVKDMLREAGARL